LTNDSGYLTSFTESDPVFLAQKGAANGVATLGADSKIPSAQIPTSAITNTFVVASEVAMLALVAETGDVSVRTDENKSYILQGADATVIGDWQVLLTPTDAVLSVNSQTGVVVLTSTEVAEGTNLYYTEGRVSANSDVAANVTHATRTDNPHSVTQTQVGLPNVDNTTDLNKPISTATQTALDGKGTADPVTTVQTTTATTGTGATIAIATGEQKVIRARVTGFESATDDTFWKEMTFGVKNVGGTVSIVGSIGSTFGYDAGAIAWTVLAGVSGSNAIVEVTGEAAHTIDWTTTIEVS